MTSVFTVDQVQSYPTDDRGPFPNLTKVKFICIDYVFLTNAFKGTCSRVYREPFGFDVGISGGAVQALYGGGVG